MKRYLVCGCVLVVAVGCTKLGPGETIPSQSSGSIPDAPQGQQSPTQPSFGNASTAADSLAVDFQIEKGDRKVEIEGVCQVTEDGIGCWKPDGAPNKALEEEFTKMMQTREGGSMNQFQFKFNKKNRLLILRSTQAPFVPGKTGPGLGYGLMPEGGNSDRDGWTQNGGYWPMPNQNPPSEPRVERMILTGSFDKDTKTFPLRYQFTQSSMYRQVIAPVAGTKFSVGGNSYTITEVSDKPQNNANVYSGGFLGPGGKPPVNTRFQIHLDKVADTNALVHIAAANEAGSMFIALDEKGEPMTPQQQQQYMLEMQKKGGLRGGGGFGGFPLFLQNMVIDPGSPYYQSNNFTGAINLPLSKIKKLVLIQQNRTVYKFESIKLDANKP